MNHSRHCNFCDHEIKSLEKGIICGITKKKPNFGKSCPRIKLNEKFKEEIESVNLKFNELQGNKKSSYLTFILLIGFGFLLIYKSGTIAEFFNNTTYFLAYKVGTIALGIKILMDIIKNLTKYREELKSAKLQKNKIDSVSKIYGINFKKSFKD